MSRPFREKVRNDIDGIRDGKGHLPAGSVRKITDQLGVSIESLMIQLLPVAQQYAVAPVSQFQVGAVAAGMPEDGSCSLYLGANFEFPNSALSFTVHAEQAATNNAWLNGQTGIQSLAISAAPCGYCRQFLNELSTAQSLSILLPAGSEQDKEYTRKPLSSYLPNAFGPSDLGARGGLMATEVDRPALTLESGPAEDPLLAAALAAASQSYAPYPTAHSPIPVNARQALAGIAVELADGSVYPGRHAENAAYNPSFSPLQSALAFMIVIRPMGAVHEIRRCVLVEVPTLASQLSATQAALAACAPGVEVEYFEACLP